MNALIANLVHDPKSCSPERQVLSDPILLRTVLACYGLHYRNFWLEQLAECFHLDPLKVADRIAALDRYFAILCEKSMHRTMIGSHSKVLAVLNMTPAT